MDTNLFNVTEKVFDLVRRLSDAEFTDMVNSLGQRRGALAQAKAALRKIPPASLKLALEDLKGEEGTDLLGDLRCLDTIVEEQPSGRR